MVSQQLPITVKGHLKITDDLGNVLVDKDNAIHTMNMSRVIARALSNEPNWFIHRLAFGNGGTTTGVNTIDYKCPNNGTGDAAPNCGVNAPNPVLWTDRLYNETYSEIVDESDPGAGTGPGSGPGDALNSVISLETGVLSVVTIIVDLRSDQPMGQLPTDNNSPTGASESSFFFDEIALMTTGLPLVATPGFQTVDVSTKVENSITGLAVNQAYDFGIDIDGAGSQTVTFTTPLLGGTGNTDILYSDILGLINVHANMTGAASDIGSSTFGKFKFTSGTAGSSSTIALVNGGGGGALNLFDVLNLSGFTVIDTAIPGADAGAQNDSGNPANEAERMISHVIFSPVLKSASRTLSIEYSLTISVT